MASAAAYPEFVGSSRPESRQTIDYRKGGAMEVAVGDDEINQHAQRVERQASLGIESREVDSPVRAELRAFFPEDASSIRVNVLGALRIACLARGSNDPRTLP
jgi:hypothetical protein